MKTTTYSTEMPVIEKIDFYNKRNNVLHFTNFGEMKVNKEGNKVLHGRLTTSYDLANYLDVDLETINASIRENIDSKYLQCTNYKHYDSSVKTTGYKRLSSWMSYEEFNYEKDPNKPDIQCDVIYLNQIYANRIIRIFNGKVVY